MHNFYPVLGWGLAPSWGERNYSQYQHWIKLGLPGEGGPRRQKGGGRGQFFFESPRRGGVFQERGGGGWRGREGPGGCLRGNWGGGGGGAKFCFFFFGAEMPTKIWNLFIEDVVRQSKEFPSFPWTGKSFFVFRHLGLTLPNGGWQPGGK